MCKIGPFIEMDLLWLSFETFAMTSYEHMTSFYEQF